MMVSCVRTVDLNQTSNKIRVYIMTSTKKLNEHFRYKDNQQQQKSLRYAFLDSWHRNEYNNKNKPEH